jgi:hypothetical protein
LLFGILVDTEFGGEEDCRLLVKKFGVDDVLSQLVGMTPEAWSSKFWK